MDPAQNDDENSLPISPIIVKDSLAQIAQIDPSETAIGRPMATARHCHVKCSNLDLVISV